MLKFTKFSKILYHVSWPSNFMFQMGDISRREMYIRPSVPNPVIFHFFKNNSGTFIFKTF